MSRLTKPRILRVCVTVKTWYWYVSNMKGKHIIYNIVYELFDKKEIKWEIMVSRG